MDPDRWHQIDDLLTAVLELEAGQRASFLAKACGGDEELKKEVESLLGDQEQLGNFLEDTALKGRLGDATGFMLGRRIGSYRLVRKIGQGGIGTVYLAERADEEYRKQVALKIIKRGMDTDAILGRFRRERQILASLQHQNIAMLLDGGTSPEGLPYFVMEYIEGQSLLDYCDSRSLLVRERLTLFRTICSAVHYAHQNQVVHRDLKPGNILVTAEGIPKLVDFGIAKVLAADFGSGMCEPTGTGVRPMTPEYASPEQVLGKPITTASDIYSLGILLYELLSGRRPSADPRELEARLISHAEPLKPSLATSQAAQAIGGDEPPQVARTAEQISSSRGTTPAELRRQLAGDLDTIVLKAMHVDPERRYGSAQELSEDIQRHLTGLPVVARKDGALYRAGRFFRRHKAAILVASFVSAAVLLVAVGIGLTLRSAAPSGTIRSIAVLPLKNLSSDPEEEYFSEGLTDELTTRLASLEGLRVVSHASVVKHKDSRKPLPAIAKEMNVDAVVEGSVLRAGERVRITAQLVEAAADRHIWAESYERDHRDILALQNELTREIARKIKLNLNPADRERLAVSRQVDPEAHADYLRGRFYWSKRTMEGFTRALGHFRRAITRDPNYALAYVGLADSYTMLADYDWLPPAQAAQDAKVAITKALEIDDSLAEAHTSLADIRRFYDWDWSGAEREYRRGIELNPKYVTAHQWYAEFLAAMGRRQEAIQEIRRAEELDPLSVVVKSAAGWVFFFVREYDVAIEKCHRVIEMDPGFGEVYSQLRRAYEQKGMYSEALAADEKLRAFKKKSEPRATVSRDASALEGATTYWQKLLRLTQADLESAQTRDGAQFRMAEIFTQLGETGQAFEWLEKAYETHSFWLPFLQVHPHLDPLRGDPRFQALLTRVGLGK